MTNHTFVGIISVFGNRTTVLLLFVWGNNVHVHIIAHGCPYNSIIRKVTLGGRSDDSLQCYDEI